MSPRRSSPAIAGLTAVLWLVLLGTTTPAAESNNNFKEWKNKQGSPAAGKILCMAWISGAGMETPLLPIMRCQFDEVCDKGVIYTDAESPVRDQADFAVKVPTQHFESKDYPAYPEPGAVEMPRSTKNWLYHKNMVGFIPAWDHLFKSGIAADYEWVLNVEADMALFRSGLDRVLGRFTSNSTAQGAGEATVVVLGNAFAFNRKARHRMADYWAGGFPMHPNGCPEFFKLNHNADHNVFTSCSQDEVFPRMFSKEGPVHGVVLDGKAQCGWDGNPDRCLEVKPMLDLSEWTHGKHTDPKVAGVFQLIEQAKDEPGSQEFFDDVWKTIHSVQDKPKSFLDLGEHQERAGNGLLKKVYRGRDAAIWHHVQTVPAFKSLLAFFGDEFPPKIAECIEACSP